MTQPKPTLVFLPGWGFQASIWESIAKQLTDYSCLLCDLPTLDALEQPSLMGVVNALHQPLPASCILIGWSLGGLIATALAQQFPAHYQKLVTVAYSPCFAEETDWQGAATHTRKAFSRQAKQDPARLMATFIQAIARPSNELQPTLQKHASHPNSELFYLSLLFDSDLRIPYQQLSQPTLQCFGGDDVILPYSVAQQVQHHYPRMKTQFFPHAGHAFFLSHPDLFIQSLTAFIEGNP